MRNSSRWSWRQQKACKTSSTGPQTCGLTRTPRFSNACNNDSESAAQRSTSTLSSTTLRATDSAADGARINSLRPISLPCRRVTTSKRAAVSRTGDTRSWQMGIAIVTQGTRASAMPAIGIAAGSAKALQYRGIPPRCGRSSVAICRAPFRLETSVALSGLGNLVDG